jgi:PadR family transcriptional regulator PadR
MQKWMSQVRKGVVELWVMGALARGETYGYELFRQMSGRVGAGVNSSTVYLILSRLTRQGLVIAREGSSPTGPERRYFRLTPSGAARLKKMKDAWKEVERSTDAVLRGGQE